MFYSEDNAIIIENSTRKVKTTYTLTLMNATSTYHNTNISFYCHSESQDPVDTVTLDLISKQKHHNVFACVENKSFPLINPSARSKLASKARYCTLAGGEVWPCNLPLGVILGV